MSPTPPRFWAALVILAAIWLLARAYPLAQTHPFASWEAWQCHKLMDYGPLERQGAFIHINYENGHLPDPARFNYINHPVPVHWWNTALYAVGGNGLLFSFWVLAKLAGFLTLCALVARVVSVRSALVAGVALALAPAPLLLDGIPNGVSTSVLLWPMGLWLAMGTTELRPRALMLGAAVFVWSQVDWLALSLVPSLLAVTWRGDGTWNRLALGQQLRANRSWHGILLGAGLGGACFVAQIIYYSPDLQGNLHYLGAQAAVGADLPRWKTTVLAAVRAGLYTGLPLLGLAALGLCAARKQTGQRAQLLWAALIYVPCFGFILLALPKFLFSENSPYVFLCTMLMAAAAVALEAYWRRMLVALAIAAMVPHLAYAFLNASVPLVPETGLALGRFLGAHSAPAEVIFTTLAPGDPPTPAAEATTIAPTARKAADRLTEFDVAELARVQRMATLFPQAEFRFFREVGKTFGPDIEQRLSSVPAPERANLELPATRPTLGTRLRLALWKVTGKANTAGEQLLPQRTVAFEIYRVPAASFLPRTQTASREN